jgi:hypothetical protein
LDYRLKQVADVVVAVVTLNKLKFLGWLGKQVREQVSNNKKKKKKKRYTYFLGVVFEVPIVWRVGVA